MRAFLRRLAAKAFSPVCQDPTAVIMGEHGGGIVRMRPVMDSDGVVTMWVADPREAELRAEACAAQQPCAQQPAVPVLPVQTQPPPLPGDNVPQPTQVQPPQQPQAQPPPLPGDNVPQPTPDGFNPAGASGL